MEHLNQCGNCQSEIQEPRIAVGIQKDEQDEPGYTAFCNMECLARWSTDEWMKEEGETCIAEEGSKQMANSK